MKVFAIDPGNVESAFVIWDGQNILDKGKITNVDMLGKIRSIEKPINMAIEMVACYGMPVGVTIFETVLWAGRFIQVYLDSGNDCNMSPWELVYRKDVKMYLCNSVKAKDSNIRQSIIDRLGAPGTTKKPGITYGVSKDIWSALAIAMYCVDKQKGV